MAPASSPCDNCGIPATLQCFGCKDAPQYEHGDVKNAFYCSSACQKEHRPQHKAYCKIMATRKKLLRVAAVCKAAVLGYRELEFDVELSKIELRDSTLYLYDNQKDLSVPPKRGPFPEHLTSNAQHREAALSWFFCFASQALLSVLLPKLLADLPCTIECMDMRITKPLIVTQVIPGPDSSPDVLSLDAAEGHHTAIKINLFSDKESWVLDVTSAQYGFKEPLEAYARYVAERKCVGIELDRYNFTVTSDVDFILNDPLGTAVRQKMFQAELPSRRRFAAFVDTGIDKGILDGSPSEFAKKLEAFKLALKLHMCM